MTSLNIVPTPQSRHRRPPDLGAIVADLRRQHTHASTARLGELLFELLLEDQVLVRAVATFVVGKLAAAAPRTAAAPRRRVMPSPKERAEHQVAEKAVKEIAAKVKAALVLDTLMPNGERLRFCRGSEVAQWGVGFSRIAEKVGPDCLVGEVLCEREAAELMSNGAGLLDKGNP
jgi:hypothetical protein